MALKGFIKPRRPLPTPKPKRYTAQEQRDRRRSHLPLTLGADFELGAEVLAVTGPVAARLAEEPHPSGRTALASVAAISEAVADLCVVAGDLVAVDRARGVRGAEQKVRAANALKAVTHRAALQFGADELASGTWADTLADFARPLSVPLAEVLGRVAADKSRQPVESDRVIEALRALDRAARDLDRKIEQTAAYRAALPTPKAAPVRDLSSAIATLEDSGVTYADLLADNNEGIAR
ncbi:hypothetical protein [Tsukamurella paurometabola]|uniref:Uncharacterized protein n=1 Tax=Tsukamurella paurometabola TaxID=2061 RepID=A0ABS5NIY9_TSUPA|nr:hypothetical protein [Tsukamurella paurometabola]MBS4103893.1 hypothetical protein [Tsukamurella paurometabola]